MFLLNKNVEKQKLISSYTCSVIRRIYCYTLKDFLVSRWFFRYNKFFLDHGSFRGIRESYELSEYSSMHTCTCKHLQQRVKGCGDFYAQQISQDVFLNTLQGMTKFLLLLECAFHNENWSSRLFWRHEYKTQGGRLQ